MTPLPAARLDPYAPLIEAVEQTIALNRSSGAALLLLRQGRIEAERYWGAHHDKAGALPVTDVSQFNLYSIRKTYIAFALSLAILEAGLEPDTPIHPYIDDIPREALDGITLRHVLTKVKPKFIGPGRVEMEGLAGRIVRALTGRSIAACIAETVWQPLGLRHSGWMAVPCQSLVCDYTAGDGHASVRIESDEGHERNLYASARDLAAWGSLFLRDGLVEGRQLVPADVFRLYRRLSETPGHEGKRVMGWYAREEGLETYGATGCVLTVLPRYEAVICQLYNRHADVEDLYPLFLRCLKAADAQD